MLQMVCIRSRSCLFLCFLRKAWLPHGSWHLYTASFVSFSLPEGKAVLSIPRETGCLWMTDTWKPELFTAARSCGEGEEEHLALVLNAARVPGVWSSKRRSVCVCLFQSMRSHLHQKPHSNIDSQLANSSEPLIVSISVKRCHTLYVTLRRLLDLRPLPANHSKTAAALQLIFG